MAKTNCKYKWQIQMANTNEHSMTLFGPNIEDFQISSCFAWWLLILGFIKMGKSPVPRRKKMHFYLTACSVSKN